MSDYTIKVCAECGNPFECLFLSRAKQRQYCSIVCRNKANSRKRKRKPETPCKNCGIYFYSPNIRIFCSDKCYHEYKSVFGDRHHERESLVKYICEQYPTADLETMEKELGLSVTAIRDIANKNGILRGKDALDKQYEGNSEWMSENNPMYRPDVAAKVSEYWKAHPEKKQAIAAMGRQANQVKKPSKLELRCAEYLTALGIEFEHQSVIKDKFVVDFRIENIILQCDGEYWHGHPRFEPLTEQQLKQQKRDAAQDKYLQACGYTVIRVWESDVTLENLRKILTIYTT